MPKGWRVLRKGTVICKGDRRVSGPGEGPPGQWVNTCLDDGIGVVGQGFIASIRYIRRVSRPVRRKGKRGER